MDNDGDSSQSADDSRKLDASRGESESRRKRKGARPVKLTDSSQTKRSRLDSGGDTDEEGDVNATTGATTSSMDENPNDSNRGDNMVDLLLVKQEPLSNGYEHNGVGGGDGQESFEWATSALSSLGPDNSTQVRGNYKIFI